MNIPPHHLANVEFASDGCASKSNATAKAAVAAESREWELLLLYGNREWRGQGLGEESKAQALAPEVDLEEAGPPKGHYASRASAQLTTTLSDVQNQGLTHDAPARQAQVHQAQPHQAQIQLQHSHLTAAQQVQQIQARQAHSQGNLAHVQFHQGQVAQPCEEASAFRAYSLKHLAALQKEQAAARGRQRELMAEIERLRQEQLRRAEERREENELLQWQTRKQQQKSGFRSDDIIKLTEPRSDKPLQLRRTIDESLKGSSNSLHARAPNQASGLGPADAHSRAASSLAQARADSEHKGALDQASGLSSPADAHEAASSAARARSDRERKARAHRDLLVRFLSSVVSRVPETAPALAYLLPDEDEDPTARPEYALPTVVNAVLEELRSIVEGGQDVDEGGDDERAKDLRARAAACVAAMAAATTRPSPRLGPCQDAVAATPENDRKIPNVDGSTHASLLGVEAAPAAKGSARSSTSLRAQHTPNLDVFGEPKAGYEGAKSPLGEGAVPSMAKSGFMPVLIFAEAMANAKKKGLKSSLPGLPSTPSIPATSGYCRTTELHPKAKDKEKTCANTTWAKKAKKVEADCDKSTMNKSTPKCANVEPPQEMMAHHALSAEALKATPAHAPADPRPARELERPSSKKRQRTTQVQTEAGRKKSTATTRTPSRGEDAASMVTDEGIEDIAASVGTDEVIEDVADDAPLDAVNLLLCLKERCVR